MIKAVIGEADTAGLLKNFVYNTIEMHRRLLEESALALALTIKEAL